MKKKIGFGLELTLLELIITIGLFALISAFNLRIFASAHTISEESSKLSHAIIVAENAAERFKSGLPPILYYDENWQPSDKQHALYLLIISESSQPDIRKAKIAVTDKNNGELFNLTAKVPMEVSP